MNTNEHNTTHSGQTVPGCQQCADRWLEQLDTQTYTFLDGTTITQAQFEAARAKALRESEPFL